MRTGQRQARIARVYHRGVFHVNNGHKLQELTAYLTGTFTVSSPGADGCQEPRIFAAEHIEAAAGTGRSILASNGQAQARNAAPLTRSVDLRARLFHDGGPHF